MKSPSTTIVDCYAAMAALGNTHPHWTALYEDATPFAIEPLQELLVSAPNQFARGVIIGKLSILSAISDLTGVVS